MHELAGREPVRLQPRHEFLVVAAGESRHVRHVKRNATAVVAALVDGIRIEVEEVQHLREQFLSRAVVVVGVTPHAAARRVAECLERGHGGVELVHGNFQVVRARLVEQVEGLGAGIRSVHL